MYIKSREHAHFEYSMRISALGILISGGKATAAKDYRRQITGEFQTTQKNVLIHVMQAEIESLLIHLTGEKIENYSICK